MKPLAQIVERPRLIRQTIRFGAAAMGLFLALAGNRAGAAEDSIIPWPTPDWPAAGPAEVGLDAAKLDAARTYAQSAGGSGMIVRHGKAVLRWGDQRRRYDIKSATKSFGATMLGVAVKDGKIDLQAPARRYCATLGVPPESNARSGWLDDLTILHLATQTAGFAKPGGYEKLLFRPGTHWHYSDGGPNWLADCLTLQYKRDLEDVMFDRVFTPLGITRKDLQWRRNQYREPELNGVPRREFGAGIHADVEALSRLGYLYLHRGRWRDQQILPEDFVTLATHPIKSVVGLPEWERGPQGDASRHYGLLWWNNGDGALSRRPARRVLGVGLVRQLDRRRPLARSGRCTRGRERQTVASRERQRRVCGA